LYASLSQTTSVFPVFSLPTRKKHHITASQCRPKLFQKNLFSKNTGYTLLAHSSKNLFNLYIHAGGSQLISSPVRTFLKKLLPHLAWFVDNLYTGVPDCPEAKNLVQETFGVKHMSEHSLETLFVAAVEGGVDTSLLVGYHGCQVEDITYKQVPYHSHGSESVGRKNVVFEVTLWLGDPSVTSNGQIVHLTLWENYCLTLPHWAVTNPMFVQLVAQMQFEILCNVTGK